MLHAELAQRRTLEGARRRVYLCTVLLRHLDGGQSDTTTGGVDEHLVAGIQLRPVEREPNRERRGRNGRGGNRAHPVRDRRQELGRHVESAGESTLHGAVDPLTDL